MNWFCQFNKDVFVTCLFELFFSLEDINTIITMLLILKNVIKITFENNYYYRKFSHEIIHGKS